MLVLTIDQRVLKYPAHAGRVWTQCGGDSGGQLGCRLGQVLKHPRASPVRIDPILKDNVDERLAEH